MVILLKTYVKKKRKEINTLIFECMVDEKSPNESEKVEGGVVYYFIFIPPKLL